MNWLFFYSFFFFFVIVFYKMPTMVLYKKIIVYNTSVISPYNSEECKKI